MDINFSLAEDGNKTETLEELNARYAKALLPLTITFGVFTFLGFFGNAIILLVFLLSREYKRNNFKVFVVTLGVIDLITCVTLIPAEMVKQRHYFAFGDQTSCKVKCFFNLFGGAASCLALLVISIDRYRKVVQPFRKQLTPKLAIRVLFFVAFLFPILLAVPGTVMCGIKTSNMTNVYGGQTKIHLCETEEQYENSKWRTIYKWFFVILMVGISFTYVVLYTFVMKEAAKQIKSIKATQTTNSSHDITFSSGIFDPNSVVRGPFEAPVNGNNSSIRPHTVVNQDLMNILNHNSNSNGSLCSIKDSSNRKSSKHSSTRSHKHPVSILQRQGFPTKTIIWFTLTIIFIVTYITYIVLSLKVSEIVNMNPPEFSTFSFFFRIYFVNHMINPLVYAIFVKRFRQSFRGLVPSLRTKLRECCT